MSLEIRPLAALYLPPIKNVPSVVAGGGMLIAHVLYLSKIYIRGGGYNAARGLISRDIAKILFRLEKYFFSKNCINFI